MSQGTVDILSKTQVSLPTTTPPPPTKQKLSFFDTLWIGLPPVQRLLLYKNIDHHVPFATIAGFLKSSLSSTLLRFLPLAGKLTYIPSTGDVGIDYSDPGFAFLEAESDIDLRPLIEDQVHDTEAFLKLVPLLDANRLPFWPFSVQVTGFKCGGVAIGYTMHHVVADGNALWQFVTAWAGNCNAEMNNVPQPNYCLPTFDREELIKHPRAEEIARNFLRTSAPDLPICAQDPSTVGRHQLARRTFLLDAPTIHSLKQRAMHNSNNESRPPSSFLVLAAHLWTSFVRAKSLLLKPEQNSVFAFLADCRTRLDPQLPQGYFGNCVRPVQADALVSELTAEDALSRACAKLSKSIAETLEYPLSGADHWLSNFAKLPFDRLASVAASPRFKVYEADFGFGRPDRVELVSMNRDGEAALVAGKDEGTVQVTVALNRNQMDAYAQAFLSDLSD